MWFSFLLPCLLYVNAAEWQKLPEHHDFYGIYLNGQKVGYQETTLKKNTTGARALLVAHERMYTRMRGMGQEVEVKIESDYQFDWNTGVLVWMQFSQTMPQSQIHIKGQAQANKLHLDMQVGTQTTSLPDEPLESAQDHFAAELLALVTDPNKRLPTGTTRKLMLFVAPLQKRLEHVITLQLQEKRTFNGADTWVSAIDLKVNELGFNNSALYDAQGRLLENHTAQQMTIRLEDEKRAKDMSYVQDILISSVVKSDQVFKNPYVVKKMRAVLSGVDQYPVPESAMQQVKKTETGIEISTQRQTIDESKALPWPIQNVAFKDTLQPTPLIQSTHPDIVQLAKRIVGSEKNSFLAAQKLLQWVFKNLKKAYTPAISNALETLHSMQGDCGEHAALFVALSRAIGIPANPVVGITYWPSGQGFGYHAWAQIYTGEWLVVDPTQGSMGVDATHIQLAQGDLFEQAKMMTLIGQLKVHVISFQ